MKVALAQMNVRLGQPENNVNKMLNMIERAKSDGCDIIAFPEMCIGGYLLSDRWLDPELCRELMRYNEILKDSSEDIVVIYGNVYFDEDVYKKNGWHPNKDGRIRRYNAAYAYYNKKPVKRVKKVPHIPLGIQPKTLLPNYRLFDDDRYFFSLQDLAIDFNIPLEKMYYPFIIEKDGKSINLGLEVCEDLWVADYRKNLSPINPTQYFIENGAHYILNISASPWTYWKNDARDRRVQYLFKEMQNSKRQSFVPFLYVNNCGAQNNGKNIVTFDGGSTVYNKNGAPVIFDHSYKEEILEVELEQINAMQEKERQEEPKIAQKLSAIKAGIEHFRDILGWEKHPRFIVGMSGGIDSSLVASLLVHTLGKEHVFAVNMPTKYNTEKTKTAAKSVADGLDIPYLVVSIQDIADKITKTIEDAHFPNKKKSLSQLNKENIQAKIRGTSILSNLAAKYDAFFTNNGNKLEIALGYATLYGDVGGAFAPIGDLTKVETYQMAQYLNEHIFQKEVIPSELIPDQFYRFSEDQIPPSAELKENQIDPMKFGYHDAILEAFTDFKKKGPETIARWYLDGEMAENLNISNNLLRRWDIDKPKVFIEDLEWFTRLFYQNIYKRVQAPPIIITSKSSFGFDIRESQIPWIPTSEYHRLKKKILGMEKYGT